MAAKLLIGLADPDGILAVAAYGAASIIRIQRSATQDGVFANATTAPIVATTYAYTIFDASGDRTSWYRWRLENATATETGDWSDPVQGWDPLVPGRLSGSYASPDDLALRFENPTLNSRQTAKLARYDQALREANGQLDDELGYSFFRSVADETRTFDGDGTAVLHVHGGIVSLTSVRVKLSASADWTDVDAGDYRLEYWADRGSPHAKPVGEPWDHVVFTGIGTQRAWPDLDNGSELTAVLGWPSVPVTARRGEIDWARQGLAADPSFTGGTVGPEQLGSPQGLIRMPDSVWRLSKAMSQRHWCDL